jgi:hypothetical protein
VIHQFEVSDGNPRLRLTAETPLEAFMLLEIGQQSEKGATVKFSRCRKEDPSICGRIGGPQEFVLEVK